MTPSPDTEEQLNLGCVCPCLSPGPAAEEQAAFGLPFFPLAGSGSLPAVLMSTRTWCGGACFQLQHSGSQELG